MKLLAAFLLLIGVPALAQTLPSWNDGAAKGTIATFVQAAAVEGRSLALIVHHDDAEREFAYDRQSHFGRLDKA